MRTVVSPAEGAELKRLYREHTEASKRAADILAEKGMDSPEFAEADRVTGSLYRRIRKILGLANQNWMP